MHKVPKMQSAERIDVLFVLQVLGNKADAVPCECIQNFSLVSATLSSPTANLIIADLREFSGNKILYHRFDSRLLILVIYIDAGLLKPHKRTHADAADN